MKNAIKNGVDSLIITLPTSAIKNGEYKRVLKELKKNVLQKNESLAKKHLKVLLNGYKRADKAYENCKKELLKLQEDNEKIDCEIKDLKSRIERTDIALDYINDELKYVFYSNTKAQLVAGNGCYINDKWKERTTQEN